MNDFRKIFAGVFATVAMASASATSIAVSTVFVPPGGTTLINAATPYDFVLDIGSIYHASTDTLNSGTIAFSLTDPNKGNEKLKFTFAFALSNVNGVQTYTVNGNNNVNNGNGNSSEIVTLNPASIADLAGDGKLSVRLAAINGDYNFVSARFDALVGQRPAAASIVPEPFSISLMGIGLVGTAVARRRKRS